MNDQAMLDHLVRKYGANSLINILQKTTQNGVASSSSSTVSASTSSARHNSVASKLSTGHSSMPSPAPSISDASSLYSERSGSDTSSIYSTNSHMTSTSSLYQRPPIAKKSSRGLNRVQPHTSYPSQLQPSPKKAPFECPFCFEGNISVEIARKSDLKRHFNNFHHTDALWQCSIRGCNMLFDWKAGFDAHVKESHQGIHRSNEDNMLKLCPQVVFACGFDNCKKVYEAESDEDAAAKVEEYHKHVADHFDSGATHKDWSHSVRFRNLMRIAPVDKAWKGRPRSRDASSASWLPQPTLVLRKLLETRHVIDLNLFVRWAATLGSAPFNTLQTAIPKLPSELTIPLRDACRLGPGGHKPYVDPAVEHTNGIDGMESSEEKTVVEVFTGTSSHATPRPQTSQTMSPPAILPRDFQSQPIATSTYLKADPEMNGSTPMTVTPPYVTSQPDMTAVTTSPQCTIPEEHGFVGQPDNSFWFYNGFTAPMPDMGGQGGMPIMHDMDKRMHEQPHMGDQSTIRPHNQSQMDTDGMMMHGYHNMNGGRDIDMSDYATSSPQNSFMI